MLRRARARLVHHSGKPGGAPLGDDDAVDARALSGAQNRAEIVRIGDLVTHDDERVLAPLGGTFQNILDRGVFAHCRLCNDALVRARGAERIELAPVAFGDDDAVFPRLGENTSKRPVGVAADNKNFIDRPSGADRLGDGVAPLDQIFPVLTDFLFTVFHIVNFLLYIRIDNIFYHTVPSTATESAIFAFSFFCRLDLSVRDRYAEGKIK